jgi:iron complex transport system substrate-binding protein
MLIDNLADIENPISKGTGNEVTMEQIALWNPDFILFGPKSVYAEVMEDPFWSELKAIKKGNYVEVPEGPHNWMGSPPAVQQYLGLIWLTAELYPEYCDYDVKEEIMEYYRLFYSCELTEEQYEELTAKAFRLD